MCGHYEDIAKFLRRNKNKIDSMETVRTIFDDYTLFYKHNSYKHIRIKIVFF